MNRLVLTLTLVFWFTLGIKAQYKKTDSLEQRFLSLVKDDTVKAHLAKDISNNLAYSNPTKGLEYAKKLLKISYTLQNSFFNAYAYRLMALNYSNMARYQEAIEFANKAMEIDKQRKSKFHIGLDLNLLGINYLYRSDFNRSLQYFQQAAKILEEDKKDQYANISYANMGMIYFELKDFDKALSFLKKPLEGYIKNNFLAAQAPLTTNMANIYVEKKDYLNAMKHYQHAKEINKQIGDQMGTAMNHGNIGVVYTKTNNYDKALTHIDTAIQLYTSLKNEKGLAFNYLNASEVHLYKRNYALALHYAHSADSLARKLSLVTVQRDISENLAKIYENLKQADSALSYYKRYNTLKDSTIGSQKNKEITRLEIQYEFDKKESDYLQQQRSNEEKLKRQELSLALNRSLLENSFKEQSLQQVRLTNEQLQRQNKERQLIIAQDQRKIQSERLKALSQQTKLDQLQFKQLWLYGIIVTVFITALIIFLLYRHRLGQLELQNTITQQKAAEQAKELIHQGQLSESELKAIRSQMNPHFIFNVLNSIETYILEENSQAASLLVQKFAKLSRLILENSTQSAISADLEWKAIKLYTELEAMRFSGQFNYSFELHPPDLNLKKLLVPPMLVQPLIENAIHHGLRNATIENRSLKVSLIQYMDHIVIEVLDNGIGINYSGKKKSNLQYKQQSIGLQGIRERIELINKMNPVYPASFTIEDLSEKNEKGTLAKLYLPLY